MIPPIILQYDTTLYKIYSINIFYSINIYSINIFAILLIYLKYILLIYFIFYFIFIHAVAARWLFTTGAGFCQHAGWLWRRWRRRWQRPALVPLTHKHTYLCYTMACCIHRSATRFVVALCLNARTHRVSVSGSRPCLCTSSLEDLRTRGPHRAPRCRVASWNLSFAPVNSESNPRLRVIFWRTCFAIFIGVA